MPEHAEVRVDTAGCIVSFDAGATKLFGYSAGDVLGQDVRKLVPERLREASAPSAEGAQPMTTWSNVAVV